MGKICTFVYIIVCKACSRHWSLIVSIWCFEIPYSILIVVCPIKIICLCLIVISIVIIYYKKVMYYICSFIYIRWCFKVSYVIEWYIIKKYICAVIVMNIIKGFIDRCKSIVIGLSWIFWIWINSIWLIWLFWFLLGNWYKFVFVLF